ncbi:Tetratricopeptide repeat, putative [Angomonas deanei]|uniref:Tetratricopeptide repeat, putative n=1 Tax=Angomonas deanei TaxID=59799 RepID=A0A7G2CC72_9TRYP|nr:Tetratricopeptide repeat, putative [Angomonas deanei]
MFEEDFKSGAELFSSRQYNAAIGVYAKIASHQQVTEDDKIRALNNISGCYASLGQYDNALEIAKESIDIKPTVKGFSRASVASEGLLYYTNAIQYMERALQLEPTNAPYKASLARLQGLVQQKKGLASQEERDTFYYKKSLEKGKEAMQAANYQEAIHQFRKGLTYLPSDVKERDHATLLCNLSAAYFRADEYEASLEHATRAAEVDPTYPRAFFRVACAKEKAKLYEEAFQAVTKCLALDKTHTEALELHGKLEPIVMEARKTPAQRLEDEAKRVRALREVQEETRPSVPVVTRTAHASNYVYCTFCNEPGHRRPECPLRKRPRKD